MSKKLQRKIVALDIHVPFGYKWVAAQPYGDWTAYRRKPKKLRVVDKWGPIAYWAKQPDEVVLTSDGPQGGDWEKSLRRV